MCTALRRGNLEDALRKLQAMIDAAVVEVTPKERNVEKEKRAKKLCAPHPVPSPPLPVPSPLPPSPRHGRCQGEHR